MTLSNGHQFWAQLRRVFHGTTTDFEDSINNPRKVLWVRFGAKAVLHRRGSHERREATLGQAISLKVALLQRVHEVPQRWASSAINTVAIDAEFPSASEGVAKRVRCQGIVQSMDLAYTCQAPNTFTCVPAPQTPNAFVCVSPNAFKFVSPKRLMSRSASFFSSCHCGHQTTNLTHERSRFVTKCVDTCVTKCVC